MNLEELRGITFCNNEDNTERIMENIMFDKYVDELESSIFEDEVIQESNNKDTQ